MNHKLCKRLFLIIVAFSICAPSVPARTPDTNPIFVFHTDEFWLNLHHFLYVLGRAENKETDAAREAVSGAPADQESGFGALSANEQKIWREAVALYAAGPSKKDIVFDDPMPALTKSLAISGNAIDPAIQAILLRASPIYRKAWWKKHQDANRRWQKSMAALIKLHGDKVLRFITNAYKLQWPAAGFPVHVSAYSNWAGAYSTTGNLLVLASQSPSLQELYGLETIFHEGMHQWDDQVFAVLREQAIKLNKFFPRGFSHSLIFFTAGEAVRMAVPSHVPYAEKFSVWQRGMAPFRAALEEIWKPYLDGQGTRDETFAALVLKTAIEPPANPPPE
ncbi:MAG: hypothetical protein ACR2H6_14075 [Pyrinomonadaceae bacterium]